LISRGSEKADYYMQEYPEMVGSEVDSARRVRALRARKKNESVTMKRSCNDAVTEGNAIETTCNTEKEIEKDKDKESDT